MVRHEETLEFYVLLILFTTFSLFQIVTEISIFRGVLLFAETFRKLRDQSYFKVSIVLRINHVPCKKPISFTFLYDTVVQRVRSKIHAYLSEYQRRWILSEIMNTDKTCFISVIYNIFLYYQLLWLTVLQSYFFDNFFYHFKSIIVFYITQLGKCLIYLNEPDTCLRFIRLINLGKKIFSYFESFYIIF